MTEIISRDDAKTQGLRTYFTGFPCDNGHVCERNTQRGECVICRRERLREYQKEYYSDPDRHAKRNEYYRNHAKLPKSVEVRNKRRERQRVALAGRPKPVICDACERSGKIQFDHCHLTGKFRGWLCSDCNIAVGRMSEDAAALRKLADYIERHNSELKQGDWVAREETRAILKDGRSNGANYG
jgi:hypothetical protein